MGLISESKSNLDFLAAFDISKSGVLWPYLSTKVSSLSTGGKKKVCLLIWSTERLRERDGAAVFKEEA